MWHAKEFALWKMEGRDSQVAVPMKAVVNLGDKEYTSNQLKWSHIQTHTQCPAGWISAGREEKAIYLSNTSTDAESTAVSN